MRRSRVASRGLALVLAGLLLTSSAFAAEVTASLLGTIRDASGAVVTGATISLTNTQTNVTKKTQSGNDGEYSFTLVPVGQYRLMVERSGFRKYVQDGIILQVNQAAKQDISLEVGAQTEVVEVTGDVAQVDTVTATLGSVETQRRIVDLPLVERDTFQLGLLQAGVFAPDPDDGSGNPFSVSGQRSESLTFLIDGVDNNDFLGNNAVVDPNPDAVEEFKILTNNYGAEYGRTSGGIVNQVIKSGTNAFHGGVFEFFRNDDLNARNYFQLERTRFNRNLFGGTLGGPIHKDKTFFFISYQGSRRIEGQVAPVLTVLSPAQRGCTTVAPGCVGTVADFSGDLPDTQLVNPIDRHSTIRTIRFLSIPSSPPTSASICLCPTFQARTISLPIPSVEFRKTRASSGSITTSPVATRSTETGSSTMSGMRIHSGSSMARPAAATCQSGQASRMRPAVSRERSPGPIFSVPTSSTNSSLARTAWPP